MDIVMKLLGLVVEFFRGPGVTNVIEGETVHRIFSMTYESDQFQYEVQCRRVIHETRFRRWWVPRLRRATFEVRGRAVGGQVTDLLERCEIFPDLSAIGLLETRYPHMRAIAAYLDRVVSGNAVIHA